GRFRLLRDRHQFIAARAAVRVLLGSYLEVSLSDMDIGYTEAGKPILEASLADSRIQFNVSHSDGLILIAFSRSRLVGVDVERMRTDLSIEDLAERFFAAGEWKMLQVLNPEQRRDAFFSLWTKKEAYLKAIGTGIAHGLNTVDLTNELSFPQHHWSILNLPCAGGFAAAVAIQGPPFQLSSFSLDMRRLAPSAVVEP